MKATGHDEADAPARPPNAKKRAKKGQRLKRRCPCSRFKMTFDCFGVLESYEAQTDEIQKRIEIDKRLKEKEEKKQKKTKAAFL